MKLSEIINELINIRLEQTTNPFYWARRKETIVKDEARIAELNRLLDSSGKAQDQDFHARKIRKDPQE